MEADHRLPRVVESDVGIARFEDMLDPTKHDRWKEFAHAQPALSQEILRQAHFNSRGCQYAPEVTQQIINTVAFAIHTLELALERELSPPEASAPEA